MLRRAGRGPRRLAGPADPPRRALRRRRPDRYRQPGDGGGAVGAARPAGAGGQPPGRQRQPGGGDGRPRGARRLYHAGRRRRDEQRAERAALQGITYDAERDFTPVGMFCTTANMLIVHNSIPGDDFAAVLAWIRANPGRFTYASASVGAITHLIMEDIGARLGSRWCMCPIGRAPRRWPTCWPGACMPAASACRRRRRCRGAAERAAGRADHAGAAAGMARHAGHGREHPGLRGERLFRPRRAVPHAARGGATAERRAERCAARRKVRAAYARVGADAAAPNAPEEFAARARQDAVRWGGMIRRLNLVAE